MRSLLTRSAAAADRVLPQRRRDSWKDSRGFTLVELLVSIGILSVILGTVGTAIFTALASESRIVDDGIAVNELRKGLGWFAEDVKQAQSVKLDGEGSCSVADLEFPEVALTWDDFDTDPGDDTPPDRHVITYQIVGEKVQRTVQTLTYELVEELFVVKTSDSHPIARRVIAACFSSFENNVTATITVEAGPHGETRVLSVVSLMRLPNN